MAKPNGQVANIYHRHSIAAGRHEGHPVGRKHPSGNPRTRFDYPPTDLATPSNHRWSRDL